MKIVPVGELDRRGSSCPILFSWNGKEYEFIADMIGPGVVGHWIAPGERDVPDYVDVDHTKMTAKLSRIPLIGDVPYPVMMEPHLVVEYYSR